MQKIVKYLLLVFLTANFVYVFSGALHYSLRAIDVYSIWLLKAREFYVNGIFPLSNLNQFPYSHPQYPILLPLLFSFIYRIAGGVKEIYVLILYPFIYLSILFSAFKLFRKLGLKENISLLFTYVYSMFGPLLAGGGRMHAGEADIFLVLIYWGILHLILNYFKDKEGKWGLLIGILIAIGSQIKMEGLIPAVIFIFIPAKFKGKGLWTFISVLPALLWIFIRVKSGLAADFGYFLPSISIVLGRVGILLTLVLKEMINYRNWYIFWALFWITIFLVREKNKFFSKIVNPFLFTAVALFAANYLFSSLAVDSYAASSIDRIMLQLSPLIFTIFAVKISCLI